MTRNPRDHRVWTNVELEKDPQGYLAAREAFREDGAAADEKKREEDDLKRFTEAFVAEGGDPKEAKAAWKANRNARAAQAGSRANQAAGEYTRRRIRSLL